ncbi:paxillin homolog 1 isoform X3 [Aricia agestis]|uniref:paxillin homolog 1 isoform X3 n=1 Tax=Aricia agestis TaxID=91739 RepID=UPI001C20626F|nr:paxillin homolog 1 isoform X3 [Aricia agestis]
MGILLSVFVSYVGLKEAAECMRHILSGVVPASDANFDELVEYYTRLQRQTANPPALPDWTADSGQGYVAWTEDADGRLRAGAIKFHGTPSNSTALLFSTKISSFGQYSVDDAPQENGDYGSNRYPLNRTKTIISDTAESFSVGSKNKSRSATPTRSVERGHGESPARMTWQYTPKSVTPASSVERDYGQSPARTTYQYTPESPTMTLPEIQFQSYDEDKRENVTYSEEYLRSRSREKSKDRDDARDDDSRVGDREPPKLPSFEESVENNDQSELIFSGEYTKAMNKDWHSGHFCCWQCDESLTGQRYVLRDEHPYCIKCYETVFANGCEECNKTIGIDSKDLSYKDKHWHEACFLCAKCRVSLVDKQFGSKLDKIYCGNCYDAQFASRCDGCGEVFRAGTKKMEYKTRQWHEKCFCCVVCKNPIGTKSFIPREQEIYCAGCYEDKFATRCVKCNKILTQGGVTYKNEPWHRECFTCTHCDTSLAGQRFTSRDDKPYCAECFGELFAKRCTKCAKPITGIGGTRFISFEDRHWHNDCFNCAQCKTSLVGKGFITDGPDIICPECARQKLM